MCRFPNLVVSILTRDSVRQALKSGITASQIVGYDNKKLINLK